MTAHVAARGAACLGASPSRAVPARIPHDDNSCTKCGSKGVNLDAGRRNRAGLIAEALSRAAAGRHGSAARPRGRSRVPRRVVAARARRRRCSTCPHRRGRRRAGAGRLRRVRSRSCRRRRTSSSTACRCGSCGSWRASPATGRRTASHRAVYLGPLAQVTDDFGNVFRRGEPTPVNVHDWQALSKGAASGVSVFEAEEAKRSLHRCAAGGSEELSGDGASGSPALGTVRLVPSQPLLHRTGSCSSRDRGHFPPPRAAGSLRAARRDDARPSFSTSSRPASRRMRRCFDTLYCDTPSRLPISPTSRGSIDEQADDPDPGVLAECPKRDDAVVPLQYWQGTAPRRQVEAMSGLGFTRVGHRESRIKIAQSGARGKG